MARLFILPKKAITTAIEPSNAAAPALQRLAALERAKASLQETCQRLTTALDRANKLYGKIEIGTDRFVTLWNASHPDQMIRRCRLARTDAGCVGYTNNRNGICDGCASIL